MELRAPDTGTMARQVFKRRQRGAPPTEFRRANDPAPGLWHAERNSLYEILGAG